MKYKFLHKRSFLSSLALLTTLLMNNAAKAQCPANIDFEEGTFNGWECWTGHTYNQGGKNVILWDDVGNPTAPTTGRHTLIPSTDNSIDFWGKFPVKSPNGSGYAVKLGQDWRPGSAGHRAEGISYTFTIPAGQNEFSLQYFYAVVVQEGGSANHPPEDQARFLIEVENLTDGTPLPCPMAPFVPMVGGMPGFKPSPEGQDVQYKPWAAASVTLNNLAGKTIRVFFKSAGCTATAHFGYAYIDIASECSSSFVGATFCPDDAFINVSAPPGYDQYAWYDDATLTNQIGNAQVINFTPPPPTGTQIFVKMTPFNGYGCPTTLQANLESTLTVVADAGPDKLICNGASKQLGVNPKPGLVYSWSPATGLSNPNISNPIANPASTTHYTLTVTHEGGGCLTTDEVDVTVSNINNAITVTGSTSFCSNSSTAATLQVAPTDHIQWYRNSSPLPGETGTTLVVTQSGVYYAELSTNAGCTLNTPTRSFTVNQAPTPGFTPDQTTACFYNHVFNFTNNSSISPVENLNYAWDFGDNSPIVTTRDASHSYLLSGPYSVKMVVSTNAGCKDSTIIPVQVNPSPDGTLTFTGDDLFCERSGKSATLSVQPADNIQWYRNTIAIPGATGTVYNVTQSGTYHAVVSTTLGCSMTTVDKTITINATPVPSITLNDPSTQCFAGNSFDFTNNSTVSSGNIAYLWTLGDGSTPQTSKNITHPYTAPGNYTIKMYATGDEGCIDSSTVNVTVNPTPDKTLVQVGDAVVCMTTGSHTDLIVQPTDNIQWYRNTVAIPGATGTTYTVTQSGDYYAVLSTNLTCSATTETKTLEFNPTPVAKFSVNNPRQCDTNNQFIFTDQSTLSSGTRSYRWVFGDGEESADPSPTHSYKRGGVYTVTQYVTSDKGCVDHTDFDIVIYVSPIPDFTVKNTCIDQKVLIANKTLNNTNTIINYLWTFGDGFTSTDRDPVHSYATGGRYDIKLEVSTALCPVLLNDTIHSVFIESPVPGIRYADVTAVFNFRQQLNTRQFGQSYLWSPATSLDNPKSPTPVFKGLDPQLYTIEIRTANNCLTVDTQYVATKRKIEIYVPTAFTPGGDGVNDYLRPGLMGFVKMNYFKIYDRWGKLLFETKNDMPGWDGRVKGQIAEMQTVIWQIEAVDVDGNVQRRQGTTVLIH